ncbi:MAG: YIP1 family protein [Candidatus Aenigmatarchaeota archaeon]
MKLLTSPVEALKEAKTKKSFGKTIGILVISAILFGLSVAIFPLGFSTTPVRAVPTFSTMTFAVIFVGTLILCLFYGYLAKLVMNILGGKGKYFEGLTTITYSIFPFSVGLFILALLNYAFLQVQQIAQYYLVTIFIQGFILSVFTALGLAVFYKGLNELFQVDMIAALVGAGILFSTLWIAFYAIVFSLMGAFIPIVPSIRP